jgi:hypothetical protein
MGDQWELGRQVPIEGKVRTVYTLCSPNMELRASETRYYSSVGLP